MLYKLIVILYKLTVILCKLTVILCKLNILLCKFFSIGSSEIGFDSASNACRHQQSQQSSVDDVDV